MIDSFLVDKINKKKREATAALKAAAKAATTTVESKQDINEIVSTV
jgi:hypothetical protein